MPLQEKRVKLVCGHKFNYEPLYNDIFNQVVSDETCNYKDRIDGKTALDEAIKHGQSAMEEKIRIFKK
jgi:hypothetical protein